MISKIPVISLRFFAWALVQVLIVKNIELGPYITPFVYVLFILVLPFTIPGTLLLLLALLLGLLVDMFYNTVGMHAAACVFTAFCRPGVLKLFAPREGYEETDEPDIRKFGLAWFISYAGIMVLIHHLFLFYIEKFSFSGFFNTFFKALMSAVFSMLLIIIIQFLFTRNRR